EVRLHCRGERRPTLRREVHVPRARRLAERLLRLPESGHIKARTRGPGTRADDPCRIQEAPTWVGSRMVTGALRAQGRLISRKRVVRLMAEEKLRHRLKRRFVHTTQSKHDRPVAPNVLEQSFEVGEPNKVWASDITYVHTRRGWAYLATVLDLGS